MLKKIKEHIIKHEKIYVLILILIAVSIKVFNANYQLRSNDELWNFSNVYKMTNGLTIYKDLNVIITPLFFWIGVILFKILGSNFVTFKIYNLIIFTGLYLLIYLIFNKLNIKRNRKILYLGVIYFFSTILISSGACYNVLAIDFYLLGILLLLYGKDKYIQGVIMFLIFMSKQNIGIYYCIGYFIYQLLENKSIIEIIKKVIKPYIVFLLLTSVFAIYLLITNNLYNFINYAFLGIGEFSTNNFIGNYNLVIYILINIIAYTFMLWVSFSKKVTLKKEIISNVRILTFLSLTCLLTLLPLMNEYHQKLSIIPTIIAFIYTIEKSFLEEITDKKIIDIAVNTINSIIITLLIGISIYHTTNYLISINKNKKYDVYYGMFVSEETENNINNILKYIEETEKQEKNVIILSYKSNLYMNILKRNNGKMDLPFYGNLGREGVDGLIKDIKNLKNTNILILKEKDNMYQESEKVRKYIMNKYEQIGEIEDFYIYKVGY